MHSLSDILFLIMSWTHLATNTLGVQKKPIKLINSVFFCNVPDALVLSTPCIGTFFTCLDLLRVSQGHYM